MDLPSPAAGRPAAHRALACAGALLAAAAVALLAYAAHAADPAAQARLQAAGLIAALHGIALAALAPGAATRPARVALGGLLLGTLLFAGSLVAAHVFGWPTRLAPFGGMLAILSWLLYAAAVARR
ncbi:MAG: DUF423 domain-containing protein [Pseudomonadota bacterium]